MSSPHAGLTRGRTASTGARPVALIRTAALLMGLTLTVPAQAQTLKEPDPQDRAAPQLDASMTGAPPPDVAGGVSCDGEGPCIVEATGMPLRVLPRYLTPLYGEPGASATPISDAVRPFVPAFVFERKDLDFSNPLQPEGWYQIGYAPDFPVGWMRARDVFEWRQALLLAYSYPGTGAERRTPVLMFDDLEALQEVVRSGDRRGAVDELLSTIRKGERPAGIIGKESDRYLDIDEDFYLLPILQWQAEHEFEDPSYYLQVAAAVPRERAQESGEGTLEDPEFRREQEEGGDAPDVERMAIDVKFVIDMTGSMQPYIDEVRAAVAGVVQSFPKTIPVKASVRFGLVGYRDDPAVTPGLEWSARNFTPQLVDAEEMIRLLNNNGRKLAATLSSDEWAEDVFAGLDLAIEGGWTPDAALKFVILVGDASAHEADGGGIHPKNTTGLSARGLRQLFDEEDIYVLAVYLKDEIAASDWPVAAGQFYEISNNKQKKASFAQLPTTQMAGLAEVFRTFSLDIAAVTETARAKKAHEIERMAEGDGPIRPDAAKAPDDERAAIRDTVSGVVRAALVDFLGNEVEPPKDFLSWVYDYDLADPLEQALDVRVLVTRQQLDNIIRRTDTLKDALETARMAQMDFFTALQRSSAQTTLGLELNQEDTLGDQDYLPQWVAALPYRSRVLGMAPVTFENLSPAEQREFETGIEQKLNYYREVFNSPDKWVRLDPADEEMETVFPLNLTMLP